MLKQLSTFAFIALLILQGRALFGHAGFTKVDPETKDLLSVSVLHFSPNGEKDDELKWSDEKKRGRLHFSICKEPGKLFGPACSKGGITTHISLRTYGKHVRTALQAKDYESLYEGWQESLKTASILRQRYQDDKENLDDETRRKREAEIRKAQERARKQRDALDAKDSPYQQYERILSTVTELYEDDEDVDNRFHSTDDKTVFHAALAGFQDWKKQNVCVCGPYYDSSRVDGKDFHTCAIAKGSKFLAWGKSTSKDKCRTRAACKTSEWFTGKTELRFSKILSENCDDYFEISEPGVALSDLLKAKPVAQTQTTKPDMKKKNSPNLDFEHPKGVQCNFEARFSSFSGKSVANEKVDHPEKTPSTLYFALRNTCTKCLRRLWALKASLNRQDKSFSSYGCYLKDCNSIEPNIPLPVDKATLAKALNDGETGDENSYCHLDK